MKSILVITHEEFLRNALELGLADDFAEVFSAESFEAGSYMISDYQVDLILLDCHSQSFDPIDLINNISELRPESKVVTIDAKADLHANQLGNFNRPIEIVKLGRALKNL